MRLFLFLTAIILGGSTQSAKAEWVFMNLGFIPPHIISESKNTVAGFNRKDTVLFHVHCRSKNAYLSLPTNMGGFSTNNKSKTTFRLKFDNIPEVKFFKAKVFENAFGLGQDEALLEKSEEAVSLLKAANSVKVELQPKFTKNWVAAEFSLAGFTKEFGKCPKSP